MTLLLKLYKDYICLYLMMQQKEENRGNVLIKIVGLFWEVKGDFLMVIGVLYQSYGVLVEDLDILNWLSSEFTFLHVTEKIPGLLVSLIKLG